MFQLMMMLLVLVVWLLEAVGNVMDLFLVFFLMIRIDVAQLLITESFTLNLRAGMAKSELGLLELRCNFIS
jgi:hypothetical protein